MSKKIKMVLYAEPGVGKSVFALGSPKPFFITTDGNYEWLEEFGAKKEDHIQVNSWSMAKKEFAKSFDSYETIVVDLLEDMFKWCEQEYCARNKIEHVSDIGFGKAYDTTRNEFFIEISKLLALDKHVILIMHGLSTEVKDRRGVTHTKYIPSSRVPDKIIDMIEGRVRYFLRAYLRAEEVDMKTVKRRYLSVVPKENEFGVCRGINEDLIPHDIPLDFKLFAEVIGLESVAASSKSTKIIKDISPTVTTKAEEKKPEVESKKVAPKEAKKEEPKEVKPDVVKAEPKVELAKEDDKPPFDIDEPKEEVKSEPTKPVDQADKMAAIKAKLAALKAGKGA